MTEEIELPDPAAAYNHLFSNVHTQVFLGKLASYGIQPATEKEAEDLFTLAAHLRAADSPEKTAQEQSRLAPAIDAIQSLTKAAVDASVPVGAASQEAVKLAAAELMQDPAVYDAVLTLKAAEAALLAGEE